jgi:hypothetical protein
VPSLLQVLFLETKKDGCRCVGAAASHRLCFARKVSSVVLPSSDGAEGDAFGVSVVAIGSAHVVSPLDAFDVVILVIESVFVV